MRIGVPRESADGEQRVALIPESVSKLAKRGHEVVVESGAGVGAGVTDAAFEEAGATIVDRATAWSADVVVQIDPPPAEAAKGLKEGGRLISLLWRHAIDDLMPVLRERKATAIGLERIPRTTIAQKMDVLSSMANIAGYRAVIEAANAHGRFLGLQMTAAGKKPPAKVLIIGAGVAGLAALGAAKALGADVRAFDTREAVKDEVQSLGGTFLVLDFEESGEGGGGYAKVMSKEFIEAEMALFREQAKEVDIVITTALIPGKKAPLLWDAGMVESMKPGSVVVDLAAGHGGNCELSQPGVRVDHNGVAILGYTDLASRMAADSSKFFGNNIVHLLRHMEDEDGNVEWVATEKTVGPAYVLFEGEDPPEIEAPEPTPMKAAAPAPPPVKVEEAEVPAKQSSSLTRGLLSVVAAAGLMGLGLTAPTELLQHLTVFVLACFVGWQVIWNVTAALHTPLMAVTNAISGIIIVGGMLQAGSGEANWAAILGVIAILFAAINVVGGFLVTHRMLKMFQKGGK